MAIHLFEEDINIKIDKKLALKKWIKETIEHEGYKLSELNYIFCSDEYLHDMNLSYLNHDTLTDIITFDNSDIDQLIIGDIFISVDRVKENANKFNVPFFEELNRVMVHGVLHLLGYKDKKKIEQEKMRERENYYLNRRSF
ncbi:MAG: rRNA maturation RNase YbeY [Sphingobacteriales bacterium]|nr:rRNA maturation RNase YbeY [Sphingobacteriales bacterium]